MNPIIVFIYTCIVLINLFIYMGFTIASIVFIGMIVYQKYKIKKVHIKKVKRDMNSRVVENQCVTPIGILTWKRIKGRMVKKFVLNEIEEFEVGGDDIYRIVNEEELDMVKKNLLANFDACHILFKNKMWYRKNGRLLRRKSLY